MFEGQGTQESKLSLHSLLIKKEIMNVSVDYCIRVTCIRHGAHLPSHDICDLLYTSMVL